ncbi:alpha/beta knot [Coemansia reversa NRRL 1564]|uniref:rRNA methyltransferase 1, mitochondrial n=1 Tax=Coemansia reversa (strain ATCC 12441 / NRRL 1564) TaxID=763665 RepID=A0A2G5B451_COERN|nr:alpha/beta knot [Coemansia reversa NRRL 1564]|eukprot:PIA13776.1 alpha/beta knot [Coemansia reversa NRRL 1564]
MRTLTHIALQRTTISASGSGIGSKYLGRCYKTNSKPIFPATRYTPEKNISVNEHLYGVAPVKAALMQGRRPIYGIYVQKDYLGDIERSRIEEIIESAKQQDIPKVSVPKPMLDKLARDSHHQGIVMKTGVFVAPKIHSMTSFVNDRYSVSLRDKTLIEHSPRNKYPLMLCLDNVQDPVNMGSVIRTGMFFGADAVIFSKESCRPSPTVSKISSGCMECMNIYKTAMLDKMLAVCRSNGWLVICATVANPSTAQCVSIYDVPKLDAPALVVIGGERSGISPEIAAISDLNIHIPSGAELPSYIDSLNAGVAAGIIMSSLPHVRR